MKAKYPVSPGCVGRCVPFPALRPEHRSFGPGRCDDQDGDRARQQQVAGEGADQRQHHPGRVQARQVRHQATSPPARCRPQFDSSTPATSNGSSRGQPHVASEDARPPQSAASAGVFEGLVDDEQAMNSNSSCPSTKPITMRRMQATAEQLATPVPTSGSDVARPVGE